MENQSMAETTGGHPYSAFFFFWTQRRIPFSTILVVRQGHVTTFGQCIVSYCHFLAKAIANAVMSSTSFPAMSSEKVVFSK